jgi:hypothetical protein
VLGSVALFVKKAQPSGRMDVSLALDSTLVFNGLFPKEIEITYNDIITTIRTENIKVSIDFILNYI